MTYAVDSEIRLVNCLIQGVANFESTEFIFEVDFSGTKFDKFANFLVVQFNSGVDFVGSQFCANAQFLATQFHSANFKSAKFNGNASFEDSSFGGASFSESIFKDTADFRGATFNGQTDFSRVKFDKEAWFMNVRFNGESLSFRGTKFSKADDQENVCRKAKNLFERNGDREEAGYHFYREMEGKRKQKPWYIRYPEFVFIQLIFGYGVHPWRLIAWWGIIVAAFAVFYFIRIPRSLLRGWA